MPSYYSTPLGRVRFLGSARLGAEDNWGMRVASLALIPLTVAFVFLGLSIVTNDYNGARALMGEPLPAVVVLSFVLTGVYHTELGMRSVIVDYLGGHAREFAMVANTCAAVALGLACVYAVLRIGFV